MRDIIDPHPDFPLSMAAAGNGIVEVSGQIGIEDGELAEGIRAQTKAAMENLFGVLSKAGCGAEHILKTRIYLTDMKNYETMNNVYRTFFPKQAPARVAIGVNELPAGALVEIECTAIKP